MSNAQNIILDEPFNAIDPESTSVIKKILFDLKDTGKMILFSVHNLDLVSNFCDKIIFIEFKNGKIEVPRRLNNSPSSKNIQIRELEIKVAKLKLDAIRTKVKDSITVCTELFSKYPRFFRKNSIFILVYNDNKNTQFPDGLHNKTFNQFAQNMFQLAQSNFHLFNMGVLEDLCVEHVYTFNPTEFEAFICNNI